MRLAVAVFAAILGPPAAAQDHSMHAMPKPAAPAGPAAVPGPAGSPEGTDLSPGDAPAPAPPHPHLADRFWDAGAMARARDIMMIDDGGGRKFAQVIVDLAEYQARDADDGFRWQAEGWFGGDIHRLVVKTEGESDARGTVDAAEVQALYSRAIGPYFNLQAGLRHDIRPAPSRTYVAVGVEGLAPYWFEVDAAAFLSTRGELRARVEGYYDQRLTQRLILQPRVELELSAQDVRAIGLGSGFTSAEAGLRLRYEIRREFAPYVGVSWERRFGDTAEIARAGGEDAGGFGVVAGVRAWF